MQQTAHASPSAACQAYGKKKECQTNQIYAFLFVQKMGVEPTRYFYHTDLNRARLPIPPLLRVSYFRKQRNTL